MVTAELVQEFLDTRHSDETPARQALLASDKSEVLAQFEARLQLPDDEVRAGAIAGLASLYGAEATDTIVRWIKDPSPTVRWVVCAALHDRGDLRAAAALLDRMKHDDDCQIRGVAAGGLGQIGALEALPDLHQAWQTDIDFDELGHSPSSAALEAMTSVFKCWVSRQIQGTPPRTFREATRKGQLTGTVTAEAIPVNAEGRRVRYTHLPHSAFGPGCATKMDLETSLVAPFEILVEYVDPTCVIRRILIYDKIRWSASFNWSVDSILDSAAIESLSQHTTPTDSIEP